MEGVPVSRRRLLVQSDSSSPIYNIWAYPAKRDYRAIPYLRTEIRAQASYVLGPHKIDLDSEKVENVPHENWTDDDEVALALRILQCGGLVVDCRRDYGMRESLELQCLGQARGAEMRQKYLFGWPESGGVYVAQLPEWVERDPFGFDPPTDGLTRHWSGPLDTGPFRRINNMEDFCARLKDLGAKFYPDARESREVMDAKLLDKEIVLHYSNIPNMYF